MLNSISCIPTPPQTTIKIEVIILKLCELEDVSAINILLKILYKNCQENDEEIQRICKFHQKSDRLRSIVSRLLSRMMISKFFTSHFSGITTLLTRTPNGRPILACDNQTSLFDWNVSHDDEFVVCATTNSNHKIGIDVMKINHIEKEKENDFFLDMKECFTKDEWIDINMNMHRFMYYWTIKEAYLKATGEGILQNLADIQITHCSTSGEIFIMRYGFVQNKAKIKSFYLNDEKTYIGAIALTECQNDEMVINLTKKTLQDIINFFEKIY